MRRKETIGLRSRGIMHADITEEQIRLRSRTLVNILDSKTHNRIHRVAAVRCEIGVSGVELLNFVGSFFIDKKGSQERDEFVFELACTEYRNGLVDNSSVHIRSERVGGLSTRVNKVCVGAHAFALYQGRRQAVGTIVRISVGGEKALFENHMKVVYKFLVLGIGVEMTITLRLLADRP
jgi:hypothetical protein